MAKVINMAILEQHGVCLAQRVMIEEISGYEREITEDFVKNYYFYPWLWVGKTLLKGEERSEFIRVSKEYIGAHRELVKPIKSVKSREPLRIKLQEDIAVLFCQLYNEYYKWPAIDEEVVMEPSRVL